MMWIATNIGAGGGTTAAALTALIYEIAKNHEAYSRLFKELQAAKLSEFATWAECQNLSYLDACIRETERLHPPVGMHLERIVPAEGAVICGKFLKGGTVVGMNPWVVNRDIAVFGEDADIWRPDRWLGSAESRNRMQKTVLTVSSLSP
jgi:cytochrome P450